MVMESDHAGVSIIYSFCLTSDVRSMGEVFWRPREKNEGGCIYCTVLRVRVGLLNRLVEMVV
jgi:hypothetical protein